MSRRPQDLFPELADGKKYVSNIPKLVTEWHPDENENMLAEDVYYESDLQVW